MIIVRLRTGDLIEDEKHLIHINDFNGYPVYKSDLVNILNEMREQAWARNNGKAIALGQKIFNHLNGDGILRKSLAKAQELLLKSNEIYKQLDVKEPLEIALNFNNLGKIYADKKRLFIIT
ncbi:MAG: hypothetical protein R8G66_09235 [Cytophagales bacterium]|nr:hypothetical protein [Cytophagales bacterium]